MNSKAMKKCFKLLKSSSSDTERLAALMMVAKGIQAQESNDEIRNEIFEAVGFKFLNRLMITDTVPEGCTVYTYRSIAAVILSCFCSDDKLVICDEMLENLKPFGEVISTLENGEVDEEQENLCNDIYDCTTAIANHPQGLEAMIKMGFLNYLCTAVVKKMKGWPKAHQLLMYIINQSGSEAWEGNYKGLQIILDKYAKDFERNKDDGKFGICTSLCVLLSTTNATQIHQLSDKAWTKCIYNGVTDVLKSKIGPNQRDPTLKLTCLMVELLGIDWLIDGTEEGRKFLLLVVHLSCVEVRIGLEGKTFDEVCKKGHLLTSCFSLLESVITFLINGPSLSLEDKQFRQLHTAMLGAFNAIIVFLNMVKSECVENKLDIIVMASVRALGSWIAEETSALKAEVVELLPFILDVGKEGFHRYRDLSLGKSQEDDDHQEISFEPLKFLMPGFCHLSADDAGRKSFIEHKGHELLAEYLSFIWEQRQKYSVNDKNSSLEDAFASLTVTTEQDLSEIETRLITLSGVLLNLIVIETDLVMSHIMFSELLNFVISNTTQLVQEGKLVLSFNFAVVGILLARQYHSKKDLSISNLENLFSTCITLLSRAHYGAIDEKSTRYVLCLSEMYEPIWDQVCELWFLGMQALCECISLYTILPHVILKSGWLPSLLKVLHNLKGNQLNEELNLCFGNLLLECCNHSDDAKKVIIEKNGVDIAKKFNMDVLKDKLLTNV